jgi:hypothetical protein
MSLLKPWEILYGDKVMPVTAHDVVETLDRVLAREYYHLLNDEKTKGHVQMKILHEMDDMILELMKQQFAGAIEEDRRKGLHMKVPGKKTVKEGGGK